ncbi:MAG: carbohydrate ABC transporter permease [Clostridiales bacterium]|nr:carbohydrate ABC transporter permease [Clostridiales bacterium]
MQLDLTSKAQLGKKKISISKILIYTFLIFVTVIYIAPLLWIVMVSFKTNKELFTNPFGFPEVIQTENYVYSWVNGRLGISLINSTIVSVSTLVISMLVGSMAAFAIARLRFKINNQVLTYFLIGMMVPAHCLLIPMFIMLAKVNLANTLIGLIIPYATFALPLTIYIMTGFFRGIPNELFEAACIDGCSIGRIFSQIALPMSRTGLFVTGLMSFVSTWNELLLAMCFISSPEKKTLPVALTYFVGPYETNYVKMFSAIVIAVLPTIIVYSMFSNQIVEGLTQGAVKG